MAVGKRRGQPIWYERTIPDDAGLRRYVRSLGAVAAYVAWRLHLNGTGGVPAGPSSAVDRAVADVLGR
jgi:hypothetical protein